VVFLPFWLLVFLIVLWLRKHVVAPRVGVVKFGRARRSRLRRFTVVMLVVNVMAFVLGLVAAMSFGRVTGQIYTITLGLVFMIGLSVAAYFLDFNRLYLYGLLVGLSFLVGEWLWARGYASHHGLPITFGTTAGIMILVGLVVFVRLLRNTPVPTAGIPSEEA
jgi:vacuolar-type H+-ATPase subunit I/STV1